MHTDGQTNRWTDGQTDVHARLCARARVHTLADACTLACMPARTHACTHMHAHAHVRMPTCTRTKARIHACAHGDARRAEWKFRPDAELLFRKAGIDPTSLMCVHVCVHVRACVRACMHAYVRVWVWCVCVWCLPLFAVCLRAVSAVLVVQACCVRAHLTWEHAFMKRL